MEIRDEGTDVPSVLPLLRILHPLEHLHDATVPCRPPLVVALVHGVEPAHGRRLDVVVEETEFTDGRIEREQVHPVSHRVHEHGARTVDDVAGGDLAVARLHTIRHRSGSVAFRDPLVNREDGTDGNVHVDVRRAVQRIVEEYILARVPLLGNGYRITFFLRRHHAHASREADGLLDRLVGDNIELLLLFALHVSRAEGTEHVHQAGPSHIPGDHLRRECDVVEQISEVAGGLGVHPLLLEDEPLDRNQCRIRHSTLPARDEGRPPVTQR